MSPAVSPGAAAGAALLCLLLAGASILWIDRPLALWLHAAFHRSLWFWPLAGIGQIPLTFALPFLAYAAIRGVLGWRPGARGRLAIEISVAVGLAIAAKDMLKSVFGRTWPETWVHHNPSLVHDGVYGFFLFHGGEGWASFPSGHTTAIAAVAGVLWWRVPSRRALWAALVVLTGIGLLGANFHFLGDIIAGAFLGFAIGTATLALPWASEDSPRHA